MDSREQQFFPLVYELLLFQYVSWELGGWVLQPRYLYLEPSFEP